VLDDANHLFQLGAHPRLVAAFRLLDLVARAVEGMPAVREVVRLQSAPLDIAALQAAIGYLWQLTGSLLKGANPP
jgi:hypothetical protein